MTFDIANVRSALKTLLLTVTGIKNVYDYANPEVNGYPCIIFDINSEQSEMLDNVSNVRTVVFQIWVMQEITVLGEANAKDSLDTVVKAVVNALEAKANTTLSGNVDWIMPAIGKRGQQPTPDGAAFVQELTLSAKVASTII